MIINYIHFPQLKPTIFCIKLICLRWYGFMYFLGFIFSYWLAKRRAQYVNIVWKKSNLEYLLYNSFIGLVIGGRIGYMLFYNFQYFINYPLSVLELWNGGMSFHGGLIGVLVVVYFFSKKTKNSFLKITDFLALLAPFGLGCGRIGNFINSELWGRITIHTPWAMLFTNSRHADLQFLSLHPNTQLQHIFNIYGCLPRHPSQIYEMLLEGVLLFIILYVIHLKKPYKGILSGVFMICYGFFRIIAECFREPDEQIGLFYNLISMGQLLSFPMIIIGFYILYNIKKIHYKNI